MYFLRHHLFRIKMPYTHRRTCSICGKQDLLKLSEHLRQVHQLSVNERQPYLRNAVYSAGMSSPDMIRNLCMETKPYPSFQFQHPATMMVVGPTQSGKSNFVEQLLQSALIKYPSRKAKRIHLFYTQWQPLYDRLRDIHGNCISFTQGLPDVDENLESIDVKVNNLWVLDDLMDEAIQSPVISQLFTRGRHRNLSVILLLQNMFPKGKFNTNISRNALYKVLFRSPGDRKQIDIMAEQTFAKDRANFMKAYTRETEKPFGYIILDNHPRTINEHQVIANVFGDCYTYPYITKSSSQIHPLPHYVPEVTQQPTVKPNVTVKKQIVKRKVDHQLSATKKQAVKRKVTHQIPAAKKQKKQAVKHQRPAVRKPKKQIVKPTKKKQPNLRKVYQPKERFTGGGVQKEDSSDEEENSSEEQSSEEYSSEEQSSDENISEEYGTEGESPEAFNELQRQSYRVVRSRGGFGPGSK